MPKLKKKYVVFAKKETNPGTYSSPSIANAIECENTQYSRSQEFQEVEGASNSLDTSFATPGLATDKISFVTKMRGSGDSGSFAARVAPSRSPRFAQLAEACGMRLTNPVRVEVSGLTVGLTPGSYLFGEVSGSKVKLLKKNAAGETFIVVEPLTIYALRPGERIRLGHPTYGTIVGKVVDTPVDTYSGPHGWLLTPVSRTIKKIKVKNNVSTLEYPTGDAWKLAGEKYGTVVKITVPALRRHLQWGVTLTGATSGAQVMTIEEHPAGQFLNATTTLATNCVDGTVVTGGTSNVPGVAVGTWVATVHSQVLVKRGLRVQCGANLLAAVGALATVGNAASNPTKTGRALLAATTGQNFLWIDNVNGDDFAVGESLYLGVTLLGTVASRTEPNFQNGETVTWTGGGTMTLKAASQDINIAAGVPDQQIRTQVISGDMHGNEVLLGTGAIANPTIIWVDAPCELVAGISGPLAVGAACTGLTSGATGYINAPQTSGDARLLIARTSADLFKDGESVSVATLGVNPVISNASYSRYAVPHPGAVLRGATSGARVVVVNPQNGEGTGVRTIGYAVGAGPVGWNRTWTDTDVLYYEPLNELTFVAGEVLIHEKTGNGVKQIATPLDDTIYQGLSLSIDHNQDGVRKGLVGGMGTFSMSARAGDPIDVNWEFSGRFNKNDDYEIDPEFPPAGVPDFGDTTTPIKFASFVIDGATCPGDFKFDLGSSLAIRRCASMPDGVEGFFVAARSPSIELTPELLPVLAKDFYGRMRAAVNKDVGNLVYVESPSVLGNQMILCAPNAQVMGVEETDRDGIAAQRVTFRPRRVSLNGDDSFWILIL